ncbi:kinase-like domain-containing protein [Gilbertella persicaria]|uniref:kinase-like domain-containing protein n=1 Tax=Gilbertella persicaria TaxID=101096 RepID=UPI00221EC658|nr:kinase-like domain-containing protein [Gilbertella persicaria]KAI8080828.1 kinase-like domain-containing protein [Gilbertella persicaria]
MPTDHVVIEKPQRTPNDIARSLVNEDKKRRNQLPLYPGLERFELIRKLGDGAFSNVFEARDLKTGKKVALKVAQKSNSADKDNGQRHLHSNVIKKPRATERANIIKEVQIMRNIRHPNIVQLLHFSESQDNYFLALDLCEGGELFHRIVKLTYFSEDLSRHVITQLASAVRYLHEECGVVHRDIKPENILFDPIPIIPSKRRVYRPTDNIETKEDEGEFIPGIGGGGIGRIKLADFGLSKVIWNSQTFTPCGTVGYTAPEIVCDKTYSKSVDMWAIGCVLYTILCGFPPFYDESIPVLTEKVAKGQYTFLSPWWDTMSDSVKDLISHLLCVDVRKRYTIDQFFNHPWITQESLVHIQNRFATLNPKNQQKQYAYNNRFEQQEQQELENIANKAVKSKELTPPLIEQDDELMADDDNNMAYTTPDTNTLRGIFDVTYAVQRMGEEQPLIDTQRQQNRKLARVREADPKQQLKQQFQNHHFAQVPLAQQTHNLPIAQKLAKHSRGVAEPVNYRHRIQPQQRSVVAPTNTFGTKGEFNLDMDNATLLKNRQANINRNQAMKIKA